VGALGVGVDGVGGPGGDGGHGPKEYTAKLPLDMKTYSQYFVQDDTEAGTLMDTKIPIKEVRIAHLIAILLLRLLSTFYKLGPCTYGSVLDSVRNFY
jgi:hypothetical protein